ncbi:MAG: hypothetical protein KJ566_00460 [Nanoarchaeota archaeon]|nr:hypothetical protein [Nanoarchaeota archaeon]
MKKSLLALLGLAPINFVSAYGLYGGFSFRNLFAGLNPNDVFLGVAFILFLFFLIKAFSKFSKDKYGNPSGAAWVPALALSIGLTYGLTRVNFDITSFFYGFGLSEDFLMAFFGIVVGLGMLYAIKEKKFKYFLIGFGILFVVLGFTELVYAKGTAIWIGVVLIFLGFKFWKIFGIFRRKDRDKSGRNKRPSQVSEEINRRRRTSNYNYSAGMRRGGNKNTRGRFVSRAAVEKYARIYGDRAARRRFEN